MKTDRAHAGDVTEQFLPGPGMPHELWSSKKSATTTDEA
jgi:hypothetical protein